MKKLLKQLEGIKVKDVMTEGAIYISGFCPVSDAMKLLAEHHITGAAVTDEDERVIGVVSGTDILDHYDEDLDKMVVGDIASDRLETIEAEALLSDALSKMHREKVHRLLVVSEEDALHTNIVGIITITDILKAAVE